MISIPSCILIVLQILHLEERFVEVNNNLKYNTNKINEILSRDDRTAGHTPPTRSEKVYSNSNEKLKFSE